MLPIETMKPILGSVLCDYNQIINASSNPEEQRWFRATANAVEELLNELDRPEYVSEQKVEIRVISDMTTFATEAEAIALTKKGFTLRKAIRTGMQNTLTLIMEKQL